MRLDRVTTEGSCEHGVDTFGPPWKTWNSLPAAKFENSAAPWGFAPSFPLLHSPFVSFRLFPHRLLVIFLVDLLSSAVAGAMCPQEHEEETGLLFSLFGFYVSCLFSDLKYSEPVVLLPPYWKRLLQRAASTLYWVNEQSRPIEHHHCHSPVSLCVLECPLFQLQGLQTCLCSSHKQEHYVPRRHRRPWTTNPFFTNFSIPVFLTRTVFHLFTWIFHLCGLVVRVLGYRSGGPGSIPGTTRKRR
jgi:hypothetical protein